MTIIKLVDRSIMPLAGPQPILIASNVVAAAFEHVDGFAFDGGGNSCCSPRRGANSIRRIEIAVNCKSIR